MCLRLTASFHSVSGCNCDLDGTWVNESASGTFYTASFASGTWVATVADSLSDMTVTYTLGAFSVAQSSVVSHLLALADETRILDSRLSHVAL